MAVKHVATINFGGINSSKTEFVDFSTPELKTFFQNLQKTFNELPFNKTNLRDFIKSSIDNEYHIFVEYIITNASKFLSENMADDFIAQFDVARSNFDIGNVHLGDFFTHVLMKDKGIGGFEQLCQNRKCNIGRLNDYLVQNNDNANADNLLKFDADKFREQIKIFYLINDGVSFTELIDIKYYNNIFLKGRKEGKNKTNKNYYMHFGPDNFRNAEIASNSKTILFHAVANLVMLTYDTICLHLMCMQNVENNIIPDALLNRPSEEELSLKKLSLIVKFLTDPRINERPDILFVTECIPNVFNEIKDTSLSEFTIEYGYEKDGLCNVIIYRNAAFSDSFTPMQISSDIYAETDEFKEVPLLLSNKENNFHLICYHANGKGVNVNTDFINTGFVKWINSLTGNVILGGDLNMDFKKNKADLDLLELGSPAHDGFSCYKQRTPLQAQFDKAGVFDTKYCDYIITRGFNRLQKATVVRITMHNSSVEKVDLNCGLNQDELVIPNNEFPFEHYIVMDKISIKSTDNSGGESGDESDGESGDESSDNSGGESDGESSSENVTGYNFFETYVSKKLSWIDSTLNWILGY